MKIAIIGKGHVGSAISAGLTRVGHEVKFGHRDPKESVLDAAKWGEVVVLAVPHQAADETVKELNSAADDKVVIDVSNALGPNMTLAVGCTTSAAEEIQKKLPKSKVVKAFNTVFAANQSTGKLGNEQLTAFIAGNDADAKKTVVQLMKEIGFDPVDCGPLMMARYLEPMGLLMINLGVTQKMGTSIGFKLVKA
jgi:8-hydroxy-5-deazaflavin:NADPH oxidoreductase